jgi:hypothetical protein
MTKVLKVKEIVEKPIYTTDEMYRLRKYLQRVTAGIDYDTLFRLSNEAGTNVNDLAMLLGIEEKKLIDIQSGKRRFVYKERLIIYFFDALYEHKPMIKLAMMQGIRSYWLGYRDAGGEIPKDVLNVIGNLDDDLPLSFKDYRQGVRDYANEIIESEEENE